MGRGRSGSRISLWSVLPEFVSEPLFSLISPRISVVFKITDNDRDVEITGRQWPRSQPGYFYDLIIWAGAQPGPWTSGGAGETNLCLVSSDQGLMGEYRSCGALCCHRASLWWRGECKIQFPPQKNPSIKWCYLVYGVRAVVTRPARPVLPAPARPVPAQSASDSRRERSDSGRNISNRHSDKQWQHGHQQPLDAGPQDGERGEYKQRHVRCQHGGDDSRDVLWPGVIPAHCHGHRLRGLYPHPHLQCHPHPWLLMVSSDVLPRNPQVTVGRKCLN